jgi:hypothetical protein
MHMIHDGGEMVDVGCGRIRNADLSPTSSQSHSNVFMKAYTMYYHAATFAKS